MHRHEIEAVVLTVLRTVLKQPLISLEDGRRALTPEWDSLKHVEVLFALEDELAVRFTPDELARLDSARAIVAAIEARHAS